jgi:hypothetical protein
MVVPEQILRCVAFVGAQRKTDDAYVYLGSAFFFGRDQGNGTCDRVFAVTAKHVIDGIRSLGCTHVYLRLNLANGGSEWRSIDIDAWYFHPTDNTVDVAIAEFGIPAELDHRVIPHTMIVTVDVMRENEVGLGEEVIITGLFSRFKGTDRNVPIVRIGNLSCLADERIPTRDFGKIQGMLIEVRSMGGLSGSPAFLNIGRVRVANGELKIEPNRPTIFLLGLVHGHFQTEVDAGADSLAPAHDDDMTAEKLNAGIAVVVPVKSIVEVISEYMRPKGGW